MVKNVIFVSSILCLIIALVTLLSNNPPFEIVFLAIVGLGFAGYFYYVQWKGE